MEPLEWQQEVPELEIINRYKYRQTQCALTNGILTIIIIEHPL